MDLAAERWSYVDWPRIRHLLSQCSSTHSACMNRPVTQLPANFRVLDVESLRIVRPAPDCRFVSMSYVWGSNANVTGIQAKLSNIRSLEQAISLTELPRTLQDAVEICKRIDERYLWLDRLCIVQDDEESKHDQINAMASIYASAYVVIIAACCEDSNQPILGVTEMRGRRKHDRYETPPWRLYTNGTVWWTRGWTYQEAVLARRKLFLSDTEAWMECDTLVEREAQLGTIKVNRLTEVYFESTSIRQTASDHYKEDIFQYFDHLKAYTGRSLTYESDIYNAFMGILTSLYEIKGGCLFGIPRADFDLALLWASEENTAETRSTPDVILPTWSWASIKGVTRKIEGPERFVGPLVDWFEYSDDCRLHKVRPTTGGNEPRCWLDWEKHKDEKTGHTVSGWVYPQLYLALALREGLVTVDELSTADLYRSWDLPDSFSKIADRMSAHWPQYQHYLDEILAAETLTAPFPKKIMRPGVLLTRGQIAHFQVSYTYGKHTIVDENGQMAGYLYEDPRLRDVMSSRRRSDYNRYEFLGLSVTIKLSVDRLFPEDRKANESTGGVPSWRRVQDDRTLDLNYFDGDGVPLAYAAAVNVMLIEWSEELAHRVAVGWIVMTKWAKADRRVKTIAIE